MATTSTATRERADLLESLATHRRFLRFTVRDLSDEEARRRPTSSELCLGGIIKHVAEVEDRWAHFIVEGPDAIGQFDESAMAAHAASFSFGDDETLADLLAAYADVASRTDQLVASIPSLDADQPLPDAPWFPPGTRRTARRVILQVIAETAQHAGHADVIRESIDGAKTMG